MFTYLLLIFFLYWFYLILKWVAFAFLAAMSVKEVLQSLVDDGMVDTDRIGTSNYFWAFPSKALHARKRKLEALETQVNLCWGKRLLVCL